MALEVVCTGIVVAEFTGIATDASGSFTVTVTSQPDGVYNWRVKGPQYLANSGSLVLAGGQTTATEMGTMRTGDANDDNVVSISDFNIMRGSFGKTLGDPGYDPRADFNNDNVITAQDVNLHKLNQGASSAPRSGRNAKSRS